MSARVNMLQKDSGRPFFDIDALGTVKRGSLRGGYNKRVIAKRTEVLYVAITDCYHYPNIPVMMMLALLLAAV